MDGGEEASSDAGKQELGKKVKAESCYYIDGDGEELHLKQEPYEWQILSSKQEVGTGKAGDACEAKNKRLMSLFATKSA